MSSLSLVKLNLMSKNNKRTGRYIYSPVVFLNGSYYFCESIKSGSVLRISDIDINKLVIIREIPMVYYMANGIVLKGGSAAEKQEQK